MKVISKENKYKNIPGKPKVRILTKGKTYSVFFPSFKTTDYFIENDIGEITRHRCDLFRSIQSNRNLKINELLDEI
jgi:hypothetical protein